MFSKQHILDEIKRLALENGGVPLGHARFESETGIKAYDWHRFWARFSEAKTEAGFSPNKLQSSFSDEHLLEKLSALVREIGKFPTAQDMRVKRHADSGFPNDKVYERLGTRRALASKLLAYSRDLGGRDDVARHCLAKLAERPSRLAAALQSEPEQLGFVYLLKSGRFYKIGRTNSVGRRERELAIQLPERAQTVHSIKTDDPIGIEAYWHRRFEPKRKEGEWFALDATDVRAFKRRKFM